MTGFFMRNYRFTINSEDLCETEQIIVNNPDLQHQIKNVLRLSPDSKEEISFINGTGKVWFVSIEEVKNKSTVFKILKVEDSKRELLNQVSFLVPVIKADAFSFMIKKLTELGVQKIIPVNFSRSQKQNVLSLQKDSQRQRLVKVIQEATEQCEGACFTELSEIWNLEDAIKNIGEDSLKIFASERMADQDENQNYAVVGEVERAKNICLLVGPEGGLPEEEVELLLSSGFRQYSLGKRLLKAETAAITLFSSLRIH